MADHSSSCVDEMEPSALDFPLMIPKSFIKFLAICVSVAGLIGTGCGPKQEAESESRGLIGVSLLTLQNPFFKVIGDTIEKEAAIHGYKVEVVSGDQDAKKQYDQVQDFIVKKASAIVLSPCDSKAVVTAIQAANKAGIPVFTVDIPCNEPGVEIVSQIATDNYLGGKMAGEAMVEVLGGSGGKVLVLDHNMVESCQLRVKGFQEIVDKHNASSDKKIEVAATLPSGGARDVGFKSTEDAMQSHPDLKAVFAINDPSALGAYAALKKAGVEKQVTIIGFDGQPEGKKAILEGKIYADPIQFPDKMGVEIVNSIVAHSKGESVPAENLIAPALYKKEDAEKDPALKSGE